MITIKITGLDQFVVGDLSNELTTGIANIYEVQEDDVNFVAPSCMIFHKGVEQTSWHALIEVLAPMKVQVLQEQCAQFLMKSIKGVAINIEIIFRYYSQDDRVLLVNDDYPRYLSDSNTVNIETNDYEEYDEDDECDDEGCQCHHHHEEEVYDGDIFEEFNKLVSKK